MENQNKDDTILNFEEYIDVWYDHHPLAKIIDKDKNNSIIIQKLDWLKYCIKHNQSVENEFINSLFEDLKRELLSQIVENNSISFGLFIDLFNSVPDEIASKFDAELLSFVNRLLYEANEFSEMYPLYSKWTRMRMEFLENVHLGFPSSEAGYIPTHYIRWRDGFIRIRETNFPAMWSMGQYFLRMYEYCKTMDRCAMAGDIVKVHDFVLEYMRDVLASAKSNGYDDYEETIKEMIENIKAETVRTPSVFISYSWDDITIADQIEEAIQNWAIVHRDIRDVESGDSLKQFMKSIRKQDFAILIVSNNYLESRNCMYEVLQLLKDYDDSEESFWNKIMLFVTATDIYDGTGRAKKVKYWTDVCNRFETVLSDIPEPASEGLVKEAKILRYISMGIHKLLDQLQNEKCDRELGEFIEHTISRLGKWAKYGNNPYVDAIMAAIETGVIKDD